MNNIALINIYKQIKNFDANYHEVFYEETSKKVYSFLDNRLDSVNNNFIKGASITVLKGNEKYFCAINDFENITDSINTISKNFDKVNSLNEEITYKESPNFINNLTINYNDVDKKEFLKKINDYCRNYDKRIIQVNVSLSETNQIMKVINNNELTSDKRIYSRLSITLIAKENDKTASASIAPGKSDVTDFIFSTNFEKFAETVCKKVIDKLHTSPFKGGQMPVIIGPGFGAVIFHEACGHALESYSIVDNTSILSNKLNKQVASKKVTIIDDGSIPNLYGTTYYDDQGIKTKKNILIKNGILTDYLTDVCDSKLLNNNSTGSARRESFELPAISRMNNTYLEKGSDLVDDMIKSIDYGLYAVDMGGGSVSPNTGEFNFTVNFGYIIENGKVTKPIKEVSLIGSALDILSKVEMVSDDLDFGEGMCGAASGSVPVTIGQPTIKVSEILVGGNDGN